MSLVEFRKYFCEVYDVDSLVFVTLFLLLKSLTFKRTLAKRISYEIHTKAFYLLFPCDDTLHKIVSLLVLTTIESRTIK